MAMGPAKGQAATLQIEMVCVDGLVAADDRLRRLDELVDWGFVRAEAAPYYAADVGRPSIDPIVLVKLMLVGALEGIDSMRERLRVAAVRVDVRCFLGYGFGERQLERRAGRVHDPLRRAHRQRNLTFTPSHDRNKDLHYSERLHENLTPSRGAQRPAALPDARR